MKDDKILLLLMDDLNKKNTAPSRRMKFILDGFNKIKKNNVVLSGTRKGRFKSVLKFICSKGYNNVSEAYVESTNSGMLISEFILLIILKLKKIPLAIYIRDAYPKYLYYWKKANIKVIISNLFWFMSYYSYRLLADQLYCPTQKMIDVLKIKAKTLPPAMNDNEKIVKKRCDNLILYSGGIGKQYDIDSFLLGCKKLSSEIDIKVKIFCRKYETNLIKSWLREKWLTVENRTIESIECLPVAGIIALKKLPYSDLAFPTKLLSYIGLEIPIIASDNFTIEKIINKHKVGCIVQAENPNEYYKAIKMMITNEEKKTKLIGYVRKMKMDSSMYWSQRAKTILTDLQPLKEVGNK